MEQYTLCSTRRGTSQDVLDILTSSTSQDDLGIQIRDVSCLIKIRSGSDMDKIKSGFEMYQM